MEKSTVYHYWSSRRQWWLEQQSCAAYHAVTGGPNNRFPRAKLAFNDNVTFISECVGYGCLYESRITTTKLIIVVWQEVFGWRSPLQVWSTIQRTRGRLCSCWIAHDLEKGGSGCLWKCRSRKLCSMQNHLRRRSQFAQQRISHEKDSLPIKS